MVRYDTSKNPKRIIVFKVNNLNEFATKYISKYKLDVYKIQESDYIYTFTCYYNPQYNKILFLNTSNSLYYYEFPSVLKFLDNPLIDEDLKDPGLFGKGVITTLYYAIKRNLKANMTDKRKYVITEESKKHYFYVITQYAKEPLHNLDDRYTVDCNREKYIANKKNRLKQKSEKTNQDKTQTKNKNEPSKKNDKYCRKCGFKVNKEDIFCAKCGNELNLNNFCPKCGEKNDENNNYCINCGYKF